MRTVTEAEIKAWEHKQRVAINVRHGEATQAEYVEARDAWLATRAAAILAKRLRKA